MLEQKWLAAWALAALCALAAPAGPAAAGLYEEPVATAELLPPAEIVATLREMGLAPTMQPIRRGAHYVLHAISADGIELRVVADAQLGDILSIEVARPLVAYVPYYVRAPHIIHIGEDGNEEIDSQSGNDAAKGREQDVQPQKLIVPAPRAVAPPVDAKLSPVRPLPHFGARIITTAD
jgi:hypothetical protein